VQQRKLSSCLSAFARWTSICREAGYPATVLAGLSYIAETFSGLLIPIGLGTAVTTLVGRSIGAGDTARAKQFVWTGALLAVILTETIGLLISLFPQAWMGLFTRSSEVIAIGAHYLRIVGPAYGFVGLSMLLYFANQGAGRVEGPFLLGVVRLVLAAGGAWFAVTVLHTDLTGVAVAVVLGALAFGSGAALVVAASNWRTSHTPVQSR
jgi:Na+-driven multidrug efflux pump